MTRYARAGKGTHQRVAKDSTPWEELKPPTPERVRGGSGGVQKNKQGKRKQDAAGKNGKRERFTKKDFQFSDNSVGSGSSEIVSSSGADASVTDSQSQTSQSFKKPSKNGNVRGFGQSKSVKILGQFWVPLEDAKRLKGLLKKLKLEGLPRKEILETLKNERRRAEKAAKRQRDKTCFQCRQFGHVLSDCPNLRKAQVTTENGDEDSETLVCFKCGSTEHTSRGCRRKGENFEFAKCFVCSGTGHIARQCPKNSKGIYPTGGGCSECGCTTHLKKDCPNVTGVEQTPTGKHDDSDGDTDAVTLRLSDPFASTEYEPMFEVPPMEEDGPSSPPGDDVELEQQSNNSSRIKKSIKATPLLKKKSKKTAKGKIESFDDEGLFEFGEANNNDTLSSDRKPTKRKIVKF